MCVAIATIQRFKLFREHPWERLAGVESRFSASVREKEREGGGKEKNPVGIKRIGKRNEQKEKYDITSLYRGFRGRYKSLFGFEYSILKHPSWASITVPSVPFPRPAVRRWALMKIYCTFRRGLHVAFSDDWVENRSLPIALLELTVGDLADRQDRYFLSSVCPSSYLSLECESSAVRVTIHTLKSLSNPPWSSVFNFLPNNFY